MVAVGQAGASSHREAPGISKAPMVDGTDFYMFRSYELDREGYVTLIANYNPLQDPFGGPNYFPLDPDAFYDIHIDNDGDAREDITYRFRFARTNRGLSVPAGGVDVPVPLINIGPISADDESALNVFSSVAVDQVLGDSTFTQNLTRQSVRNAADGNVEFRVPADNIGTKSIPDYAAYADSFVFDVNLPSCGSPGRMFVGQRKEPFYVALGPVFDLVRLDPVGDPDALPNATEQKSITSLILEVPIACLTRGNQAILGGWTTASTLPSAEARGRAGIRRALFERDSLAIARTEGARQVSRLGSPLVNEVVIGIEDKDTWNASRPRDDGQFLSYVTNPSLPELLEILFGVRAPDLFPRTDLVQIFVTGIPDLTENGGVGEMLRLNTAIAPTPRDEQSRLGVLGGDLAGYPNGRRPGDDVVDISLRAVMGVLLPADAAPDGQLPYTDQVLQDASQFTDSFPYLQTPLAGSDVP